MTSSVRIEDVDKLLGLFQHLEKFLDPELPAKNNQLWVKSVEQAREELADQLKKRQSGITLRPGWNAPLRKTSRTKQKENQKQFEKRIHQIAEKNYYAKDLAYAKAIDQSTSDVIDVMKKIDHLLLAVREQLLQLPRVKKSLLAIDWKEYIRNYYPFLDKDNFSYQIREAIDVLEALKVQFERQKSSEAESKKDQKPAEPEQKATLSKGRRLWNLIKRVPRWIYFLIIFLSALLTCIYFLWWLWTTFWKK